jgi:hypothetical protein
LESTAGSFTAKRSLAVHMKYLLSFTESLFFRKLRPSAGNPHRRPKIPRFVKLINIEIEYSKSNFEIGF